MAPAVGKPWLVTLRSTRNSASPTSTRTIPMAGVITIVSKAPPILSGGMRATLTSSVGSDFTAHRPEAFCKVVARGGIPTNILPAALLFVGLAAYDVLNFGVRYANTDGRIMPRSGRVFLYFGAVLLVTSFALFYLNARVVRTGQPHFLGEGRLAARTASR